MQLISPDAIFFAVEVLRRQGSHSTLEDILSCVLNRASVNDGIEWVEAFPIDLEICRNGVAHRARERSYHCHPAVTTATPARQHRARQNITWAIASPAWTAATTAKHCAPGSHIAAAHDHFLLSVHQSYRVYSMWKRSWRD